MYVHICIYIHIFTHTFYSSELCCETLISIPQPSDLFTNQRLNKQKHVKRKIHNLKSMNLQRVSK